MPSNQNTDPAPSFHIDGMSDSTKLYLDAVLNAIEYPIFIKDEESRLVLVNDAFCDIFGLPRTAIIAKTLAENVSPSEMEHFLSIDKQVLEFGKPISIEENLTVKGMQAKTILTKKSRFVDPKGNSYIIGIIRDITEIQKAERAILEKDERLSLALLHSKIGIWEFKPRTQELIWDDSLYSLFNMRREDYSGDMNAWAQAEHPDDIESTKREMQEAMAGKTIVDHEFRVVWPNSEVHLIHDTAKIFYDDSGTPVRLLGVSTDVTEKNNAELKLKLFASVFFHAGEGIMITDANSIIIEVNDTFCKITGYTREEVLGKNPNILRSERQSPEFYAAMWDTLKAEGSWKGEIYNRRKNGDTYAELLTISAVQNATGQLLNYVAIFSDISLMKKHQDQLEHIAHYDVLTNLPNRVLLTDRLNQSMLQSRRNKNLLAVAFLDLDGFKEVNDTYGHSVGDSLLIALSEHIGGTLRGSDTLARIGGDEFIFTMAELVSIEDSKPVLDRMLQTLNSPITIGDITLRISASIGVAIYPRDGTDADILIRKADQAMYSAKQAGKNRYHLFDSNQDIAVTTLRETVSRITQALERREFVLHYQPKVNMRTGEIIGLEALIRWQHSDLGLLFPAAFLPDIENHPVILDLGEWVADTAMTQMRRWQEMGLNLQVSVNISASQLQQNDFPARIAALLKLYPGVPPHFLELEILETSALKNISRVSTTMRACTKLGVKFSIDDFGTGYSSLTYLRHLPADLIKIDQSFVRDMLTDSNDLAIVEAVIGLAKTFKRQVLAEGVETTAHGIALLQLGCELAQGYGIAKPMPADEIPEWIKTWKPNFS